MKNNPLKSDEYIQQLCITGINAHKKKNEKKNCHIQRVLVFQPP